MAAIFRQYILPLIILIAFLFALFVVTVRNFLPDMAAPAAMTVLVAPPFVS
jgi:hypothetical protein